MLQIKVLSYNLNNKKGALNDLYDYINNLSADILLISIQEYFSVLPEFPFSPYVYHKKIYGLHSLILSKLPLTVDFYVFCLGPLYLGNKGFILANINDSIIFTSVHLQHGEGNYTRRTDQFTYLNNILGDIPYPIILAGDFNFRFIKKSNFYRERDDEFVKIKEKFGYSEMSIRFGFTYKYKGSVLDDSKIPSYCDRIIYRNVQCLEYSCLESLVNSDHKLVTGNFEISEIKMVVENKHVFTRSRISEVSCFIYENVIIFTILIVCIVFILRLI
ncbi:inositol polyphosphate 5-phosphatase [Vairimorpha necatrix]|uniref:Inositol polyphosphate 5-phosphatase n=1 Tax=Vairimorpha necatrix TaxID=6039 RepID=A0AAX4J8B7_9MICR